MLFITRCIKIIHMSRIKYVLQITALCAAISFKERYFSCMNIITIDGVDAFSLLGYQGIGVLSSFSYSRIGHNMNIINNLSNQQSHSSIRSMIPQSQDGNFLNVINDGVNTLLHTKSNIDPTILAPYKNNQKNNIEQEQAINNRFKPSTDGLSKFHQSIVARSNRRQRCVTGRYPISISVVNNPTRKWLSSTVADFGATQMLVNGTSVDRSLASFETFQWLDDHERELLHDEYSLISLELIAEINVKKPGYVNILPSSTAGVNAELSKRINDEQLYSTKPQQKIWSSPWKINPNIFSSSYNGDGDHDSYDTDSHDDERVWISGFSVTKSSGEVNYVNVQTGEMGNVNHRTKNAIRWPNEMNLVPKYPTWKNNNTSAQYHQKQPNHVPPNNDYDDALLVSDGFLVPGKDNGGIYVISNPGHADEWTVCLAGGNGINGLISKLDQADKIDDLDSIEDGWFYHRAIWVDLTGDGRQSILTARAKRPPLLVKNTANNNNNNAGGAYASTTAREYSSLPTKAQLVWLERPKPHRYDERTGTPLDADGLVFDPYSPKHTPWKLRVLDEGPDVMFSVADLDPTDDTIEVIASQFFNKKLSLHSIQIGSEPKVVFSRIIDENSSFYSSILADLDVQLEPSVNSKVVDSGSTVPTLKPGDSCTHILVTSHQCDTTITTTTTTSTETPEGLVGGQQESVKESAGSLFSYRIPQLWKTDTWIRTVIATGFRVRGQLGNMINPGAPGFCYTFHPKYTNRASSSSSKKQLGRPLIGIAGDCAEAAYILRPTTTTHNHTPGSVADASASYVMMCEIECGATVGSIGIGYGDFCSVEQESGYAKLYIPCYEKDKVLVFAMGSGEED